MIRTRLKRVAIVVLAVLAHFVYAVPADDAFDPTKAIRAAVSVLEKEHVTRRPPTADFDREWISKFVGRLDPHRMYFLESDLDEFQRLAGKLFDSARAGDFRFPLLVRERYRARVPTSLAFAAALLPLDRDYTIHEECPREFVGYASSSDDLKERWRLRIKAECLVEKLHGRNEGEVESQLSSRFKRISRQASEMTDELLCEVFIDSLAATYDPNSTYWSPTTLLPFQTSMRRNVTLGLRFRQEAGRLSIESIHPTLRSSTNQAEIVGWSLIAVRRMDGTIIDLVERHSIDWSSVLQSDAEVILELQDPVTSKRRSVAWVRHESNELGDR